MKPVFRQLKSALPLVALAVCAVPAATIADSSPFVFDTRQTDSVRFSRVDEDNVVIDQHIPGRAQFGFSVRANRPDFSREGGFGLNMLGGTPELDLRKSRGGVYDIDALPRVREGFRYSASVRIEQEDADIDGTAYVSSSLLGVSYGRLGQLWYGAVDFNLEQFDDDRHGVEQSDIVSLDFTTGRRMGLTGVSPSSPLWLLSLQGSVDVNQFSLERDLEGYVGNWYVNPTLLWQHPGFTFSAEVQVPVETLPDERSIDEPDYRLRAIFEKQF